MCFLVEIALASFMHAMNLMKIQKESSSVGWNDSSAFSNSRLHYLIASTLIKQQKFQDAIEPLQFALSNSRGFHSLNDLLEKMLIQCYNKVPSAITDVNLKVLNASLSLLLRHGIRSPLSSAILNTFNDSSPNTTFETDHIIEIPYCSDDKQPFNFALTFPNQSHVIQGDVIDAVLQLRSNLKFPVRVKVLLIEPNLDPVKFEVQDQTDWVLRPDESKEMTVKVIIPSNVFKLVDAKLVQSQSLKGERLRSCGLTKIGGGVYSNEIERKKASQGGLCVGCVAIDVELSLPSHKVPLKIKIHNVHRGSIPCPSDNLQNKIQTSTEEDNYIYSAWGRPSCFPMSKGPRCLRVLKPQPNLEIRDLTTPVTNGIAIEGTVNRILLALKSESNEYCRNVKMSITCENTFENMNSNSQSLLDKEQDRISADPSRHPVVVQSKNDSTIDETISDEIPIGWALVEKSDVKDDWRPVVESIGCGESIHTFFDLFRPLAEYEENEQSVMCTTNFCVKISYDQVRPNQFSTSTGDLVVQEYRGSVQWRPPVKAEISFSSALKKILPSGSRHLGNKVANNSSVNDLLLVQSGGKAFLKCSIRANEAENNLPIILSSVKFEVSKYLILTKLVTFPRF